MIKIAIHSAPRSGSSWVGQILNSSPKVCYKFQPLFSYAFSGALNEYSTNSDIETFFRNIYKSNDDFLNQTESIKKGIYPMFKKDAESTHIVYKEVRYHYILENLLEKDQEIKVIGIVRNPFAVINSFLNSPREFRADLGWKEGEEWEFAYNKNAGKRENYFGYSKWKEVANIFLSLKEKYPDRFYLLSYDDLIKNTHSEVRKTFNFCNLEFTQQTSNFIDNSKQTHKSNPYSVYKKKGNFDNNWKGKLDSEISNQIQSDYDSWKSFVL